MRQKKKIKKNKKKNTSVQLWELGSEESILRASFSFLLSRAFLNSSILCFKRKKKRRSVLQKTTTQPFTQKQEKEKTNATLHSKKKR